MAVIYVDRRSSDVVQLPRDVALRAAETVQAIATEAADELERLHSLACSVGSPELESGIARLIYRYRTAKREMHDFAGVATEARCPDGIAEPAHGRAA